MPTTEERLAGLEAQVDRTNDLFTLVANLNLDMNRQFADVRADLTRLDGKVDRDFRWVVGMLMTLMLTTLGLIAGAVFR